MTSIIKAEQTARTTERILIKLYENILKEITLDELFPNSPDMLRMKYERLVYDVTRKAIETAHHAALDYVGASLKVETFMTETDIQLIKVQTNTAVEQFFGSLRKACEAQQEADFKAFLDNLNKTQLYGAAVWDPITSLLSSFTRIAVSVIAAAFGGATKQKTAQLTQHPLVQAGYITETGELTGEKPRIKWIAQHDEKTCSYCLALDGEEFDADDPGAPVPGVLDSSGGHPNCRCYYELVQ
jgi:hypothetical protein